MTSLAPSATRAPWTPLSRHGRRFALTLALLGSTIAVPALARDFVSVARDEINMRNGPGTKHESRWMLSRGFPLQVVRRQGDWLRVRDFEKDEGWVSRSLTDRTPHVIVTSTTANIRSGPATNQRRVGQAEYGEVLRMLGKRPGWVQVSQAGGTKGWVARKLVWGW